MIVNLFMFVGVVGFKFVSDWWVSQWATKNVDGLSDDAYPLVYLACTVCGAAMIFLRAVSVGWQTSRIAASFHHRMVDNIIQRPLSYFDTTPLGQILNRFSKDIDD